MSSGHKQRVLGGVLVAAGLMLLFATGAYYANGLFARSTLDDLETVSERPSLKTLDPQDSPAPEIADVPAPAKAVDEPRAVALEAKRDDPPRQGPEPRIAALAVTAATDAPVAETLVPGAGPDNAQGATGPVFTRAAPEPVAPRQSAEPVVIHKVNAEPVVVRVAAEITRVQRFEAVPSKPSPSAASGRWEWRGVRDTSNQVFSDDDIARVGPTIAYAKPVEEAGPETPTAAQVQPTADTSGSIENGDRSAAVTSADTSGNGETATSNGAEAVATTPADAPGNAENGAEKVTPTQTDTSGSGQPVAETVALTPAQTGEALLASYVSPGASVSTDASAATWMHIPAIGVESGVRDLRVVFKGQSAAWETPDNIVGHIPTTARPGAAGQGWYFGHLDSPVRGEGNVFRHLPKIPELTKSGPVYIFLETASHSYAYQVYKTEVVYQGGLKVGDSGQQDITLVTCVPRFYYDHRLLVTAALVGVKPNGSQSG